MSFISILLRNENIATRNVSTRSKDALTSCSCVLGICPNCKRLLSGIKQTEMDLAAVTSKDSEITFKIAHISLVRWSILKTTLIRSK